jgi:hypothetical protein
MEFTYDNVVEFMKMYYHGFPEHSISKDTLYKMYEFYSPKLKVVVHLAKPVIYNRDSFLNMTSVHPHFTDRPTGEQLIIDIPQKKVAALVRTDFTIKATGQSFVQMMAALYRLELDEKKTFKITEILMFPQPALPGEPDIDVLMAEAIAKSPKST